MSAAPDSVVLQAATACSTSFNATLTAAGADVKRLAVHSPNTNAYVKRFIEAIQQECLDQRSRSCGF